jgi:hypothetical protein
VLIDCNRDELQAGGTAADTPTGTPTDTPKLTTFAAALMAPRIAFQLCA